MVHILPCNAAERHRSCDTYSCISPGILRYTGLITITAETTEDLDAHVAALEQAAIQANCETRLLAGQQAKAFTAAALPLCRQV